MKIQFVAFFPATVGKITLKTRPIQQKTEKLQKDFFLSKGKDDTQEINSRISNI